MAVSEFSDYDGPVGAYIATPDGVFPVLGADGGLTPEYVAAIFATAASWVTA